MHDLAAATPVIPALIPVRDRFLALILPRMLEFETLGRDIRSGQRPAQAIVEIGNLAHKIAGVAETLGFAVVGQCASAVDRRITIAKQAQHPVDAVWRDVEPMLESLQDALEALLED